MSDSRKCPLCGVAPGATHPPWCDLTFDPGVLTLAHEVVDMKPPDETVDEWAARMSKLLAQMND